MKLLLTSNGFTTPEIIAACVHLVSKPRPDIKIALINEAYAVERGNKRWVVEESQQIIDAFPGFLDIVNLLALKPDQIRERLEAADVIFVLGGHTDYQMYVFNKSGLSDMLPELLKTKVYVGSSAGAMVLGKRVNTEAYQRVYAEGGTYGVTRYLEFVDFAMKPHLGSTHFVNNREAVILDISKTYDAKLYALKDTQAIQVIDGGVTYLGGKPFCAQKGAVVA